MFNTTFDDILDRCLERIEDGESIESCLNDYPRHANELRGSLEMAARLHQLPVEKPSLAADFFFQQQLEQVKPTTNHKIQRYRDSFSPFPLSKLWGLFLEFGFMALIVTVISFVLISHSTCE